MSGDKRERKGGRKKGKEEKKVKRKKWTKAPRTLAKSHRDASDANKLKKNNQY